MNTQVLDPEQPESTFQFGPEDFEYEENLTEPEDLPIFKMLRKRTAGTWRMKRGSTAKGKIRILKRSNIGNFIMVVDPEQTKSTLLSGPEFEG